MSIQILVYFIGVFVLGLFYAWIKSLMGGGGVWFVAVVIGYLLLLRLIGYVIERVIKSRRAQYNPNP